MSKPIAVFFADSHLQDRAWSERPIEGDSYFSLKQIFDFAIDKEVEAMFGAGDLIDRQVNKSRPITEFYAQLDRLQECQKPFSLYYIQGQHEMQDQPWLSAHPAATHLNADQVTLTNGTTVWGLDFHPAIQLQIALSGMPARADILLAHQVWGEFMGSVTAPQGGMGDVPYVNTVVTGDYHHYADIKVRGKDGQEVRVLSPGSTCMQSIDEPPKKWFLVMLTDGTFKKVPLRTRPFMDWEIVGNEAEVERFCAEAPTAVQEMWHGTTPERQNGYLWPEACRKPLLRVTYSHKVDSARRRLAKVIGDGAHIVWKEIPPEKPEVQARRDRALVEGKRRATTLESELPGYLEAMEMPHLLDPCTRLLQATNVEDELRRLREEALQ